MLVDHVTRDADGLVKEIQYGDAADTTTAFSYDDLRRLRNLTTYRSSQSGWTNGEQTQQMLLQDEQFTYDRVGNPVEVRDWRDPEEWPTGAKPVTRKMQYDDLYRLSRIDYQQVGGEDPWKDPYAAEVLDNTGTRPQPSPRADFSTGGKRVQWQTYAYDWLGNTTTTDDDQHAFYDRSLGTVGNGTTKRYQLDGANNTGSTGTRNGSLSATYDAAGNLLTMDVGRDGKCVPAAKCLGERLDQHFEYEWDEVGRLTRAQRWDENPPVGTADADLSFTYDASDQRVRKTSGSSHTLYVFGSLELRRAAYDGNDYVLSETTEVPYLFANGVRLGRVVHDVPPDDYVGQSSTRVFLELGDHLGSTSVVLDLGSGELVQRSTAYAYGEVESSLRPGRWESFREDYRFTGKEDDVEVGLIYFGKRFYNPLLQRWISPDPLAIHAPGEADLNVYAYVHGRVLVAVDPVGLADKTIRERIVLAFQGAWTACREDSLVRIHAEQKDAAFINRVVGQDDQAELWEGQAARTEQRIADKVHYDTTEENVGRLMWAGGRFAAGAVAAGAGGAAPTRKTGCFVEGTTVWTPSGPIPIEDVRDGDIVWSMTENAPEAVGRSAVVEIHSLVSDLVVDLTLTDGTRNETIGVTREHPFWRGTDGWVQAGALVSGDRVWSLDGWLRVVDVEKRPGQEKVFNLTVDSEHTFFVGELRTWVHNKGAINTKNPPPRAQSSTMTDRERRAHEIHDTAAENAGISPGFARKLSTVTVTDNHDTGERKVTFKSMAGNSTLATWLLEWVKQLAGGEWRGHDPKKHSELQEQDANPPGTRMSQGSSNQACYDCQKKKGPNVTYDNPKPGFDANKDEK